MSRRNRRTSSARTAPLPTAAVAPAPAAVTPAGRTISWRHCLVGLVAGEALLLLLGNLGPAAANAVFGSMGQVDGGILGVATLLSVMAGGYLAARLAGRYGLYQGIVVACGFIAVSAVMQFLGEASIVHKSLAAGSHHLVDLGPMNIGDLMSNDLLALFAGSVGGLFSGKR
jgi:hypothetical protein